MGLVRAGIVACALGMAMAGPRPGLAQDSLAQFYRGRTLTFLVGAPPGGGYDLYGRMVAKYLPRHLPGTPASVVSNMVGAGGNLMVEYVSGVGIKDGTVIGTMAPGTLLEPLLGDRTRVHFDPVKLAYLGSANREIYVCFVRADATVKRFEDVFTTEVVLGATAEGGTTRDLPMLISRVLGARMRVISGYPGTRNIVMAIEKGEVQGQCGTGWSSITTLHPDWFRDGTARVLAIEGTNTSPELQKMGVPFVLDFAKTPEQRRILELVYSQANFGRPFIVSPEVPAERIEALRRAFDETMRDPEFLAETQHIHLDVSPMTGDEVQKEVAAVYALPPEIAEKAREAMAVAR